MKQDQVQTTISLRKIFLQPKTKRPQKAIKEIKAFVQKHAKNTEVTIANEVNELLHLNSRNIPRKINAVLVKNKEKVTVYLQGGKQLEQDKKKQKEEKAKTEKKEKEKTQKKEAGKKEPEEDNEKKLEEKRQREKAAKSLEMKSGRT